MTAEQLLQAVVDDFERSLGDDVKVTLSGVEEDGALWFCAEQTDEPELWVEIRVSENMAKKMFDIPVEGR